jgi:hypothetical protein
MTPARQRMPDFGYYVPIFGMELAKRNRQRQQTVNRCGGGGG